MSMNMRYPHGIALVPPPSTDATLDSAAINGFRRDLGPDAPEFIAGLIDQFVTEAGTHVAMIVEADTRGDLKALNTLAHNLKGSSLTLGATRLAGLCARLEDSVHRG